MVNITKSTNEPASLAVERLKVNGDYRQTDVLTQTRDDFHNKCYLCEDKNLQNVNIEHFIPHRGNNLIRLDWNNLFYCCFHCNNTKGDKLQYDNILNCTNPDHKVMDWISLHIDPFPFEMVVVEPMNDNVLTRNTAVLLTECYNGSTTLKKLESESLRTKIVLEIRDFQTILLAYFDDTNLDSQKIDLKDGVRRMLSEKSMFTAFKVWIIKNNNKLLEEFGEFIPTLPETNINP